MEERGKHIKHHGVQMFYMFPFFWRFWHLKSSWKTDIKLHNRLLKIGIIFLEALSFLFRFILIAVVIMIYCDDRYKRAQLALGKGDEDLAREALKRRKSYAVSHCFLIGWQGLFVKFIYWICQESLLKIVNTSDKCTWNSMLYVYPIFFELLQMNE